VIDVVIDLELLARRPRSLNRPGRRKAVLRMVDRRASLVRPNSLQFEPPATMSISLVAAGDL